MGRSSPMGGCMETCFDQECPQVSRLGEGHGSTSGENIEEELTEGGQVTNEKAFEGTTRAKEQLGRNERQGRMWIVREIVSEGQMN